MQKEKKHVGFRISTMPTGGGYTHLEIEVHEFTLRNAAQEYRDAIVRETSNADWLHQVFQSIERFKNEIRSPMSKPGMYLDGRYERVTFKWLGSHDLGHWYAPEVKFPNEANLLDLAHKIMRQVYKRQNEGRPIHDPAPQQVVQAILDLKGFPVRFVPDPSPTHAALPLRAEEAQVPPAPGAKVEETAVA